MAVRTSSLRDTLPLSRTRLIGREADLIAARALLADETTALLTFTGSGGVGKTGCFLGEGVRIVLDDALGVVGVEIE